VTGQRKIIGLFLFAMRSRSFPFIEGLGYFPTSNFADLARRQQRVKYGSVATFPMLATFLFLLPTTTGTAKMPTFRTKKKRRKPLQFAAFFAVRFYLPLASFKPFAVASSTI